MDFLYNTAFWKDYFWLTDEEPCWKELAEPLRLTLSGGYTLELDTDTDLSYISLGLAKDGAEALELGWDDEAHWNPLVFRFEEFDAVVKTASKRNNIDIHWIIMLLGRFLAVDHNDNAEHITAYFLEAWKRAALHGVKDLSREIRLFTTIKPPAGWVKDGKKGWIINDPADEGLYYSLRNADGGEFPFELYNSMLKALLK